LEASLGRRSLAIYTKAGYNGPTALGNPANVGAGCCEFVRGEARYRDYRGRALAYILHVRQEEGILTGSTGEAKGVEDSNITTCG
jgi:hypothetical protein